MLRLDPDQRRLATVLKPCDVSKKIEQAIRDLRPEELAEFRQWFAEFDHALWDAQIEADAKAGRLDALARQARAAYDRGETREL